MQKALLQDKGLIGYTNLKNGEKMAMREQWYGDSRDLIKWSVLLRVAEKCGASKILQIAYLRPSLYRPIVLGDYGTLDIPVSVIAHFRSLKSITSISADFSVEVFDQLFVDRDTYLESAIDFISEFDKDRCVVFLDPDTGLQPQTRLSGEHVSSGEVSRIWCSLKAHDMLVLYQHKTNRNGSLWIKEKQVQLAQAIGAEVHQVSVASSYFEVDRDKEVDVVFYFVQKK